MFDLYNNIELLCQKHGTSPTKVCEQAGLSRSTLSNLKNGRARTLTVTNAMKIAEVLGESYDTVMHGIREEEDVLQDLKDEERVLLHSYRTMSEQQKQMMQVFLKGLKDIEGK